ncbi:hypothetical protein D3C76_1342490 [compost metagenome]
MFLGQGGQALEHDVAMQQVVVRQQPFLGYPGIELQAIAIVRVDAVVGAQVGVADAGHEQGTETGIVAQPILLALPLQGNDPLPTAGQLAVPFRPHGQQFTDTVGVGDFFVLITACQAQLVGQGRVEWDVIEQADVLPWRRQFHLRTVTVAPAVDPVPRPVSLAARAHVR